MRPQLTPSVLGLPRARLHFQTLYAVSWRSKASRCPHSQGAGWTWALVLWQDLSRTFPGLLPSRPLLCPSFLPSASFSSFFALPWICSSLSPTPRSPSSIRVKSEITPPPSGEPSPEPAAPPMRPEILKQTEAGGAPHPTSEGTPSHPQPKPGTFILLFHRGHPQLPGVGLLASCSPQRGKRQVSLLWLVGSGRHRERASSHWARMALAGCSLSPPHTRSQQKRPKSPRLSLYILSSEKQAVKPAGLP